MIDVRGVAAIVTDIEGTTSSIAFVHEVLFPYARRRLADYVASHHSDLAPLLDQVRALEGDPTLDEAGVVAVLTRWSDEDRKAAPLKTLQGMIWRQGYESGHIVAHVYDDAAAGLRRWRAAGLTLAVYSSGSVQAQKLLFGHSRAGDLAPLFSAWFDTAIGAKREPASYAAIASDLALDPARILFLSDTAAEVDAAAATGLQTLRLVRGALPASGEVASFDEIEVVAEAPA